MTESMLTDMRRLYDLHARLAAETDLHAALETIVGAANDCLETDRGCIQLVSADGRRLEMFAYRGYAAQSRFVQHFLQQGSEAACDAARRDRRWLLIEDVETFPALVGTADREVALEAGIRAAQHTPLSSRSGELLGMLSNQFREPHRPAADRLAFIDLLAWTAAGFIERHQAEAVLRGGERRQAFWLKLSDALRAAPDEAAVANLAVRLIADELALDRCYVAAVLPEEDRARATHQFRRAGVPPVPAVLRLSDFPAAFGLTAERTLVSADTARDPALSARDKQSLAAMRFGAVLAPCLHRGEGYTIWALVAVMAEPRRWTPGEVTLLEQAAERTWAMLERARSEAAQRASEGKYRTLFDSIDQGFCVIEVFFYD